MMAMSLRQFTALLFKDVFFILNYLWNTGSHPDCYFLDTTVIEHSILCQRCTITHNGDSDRSLCRQ